VTDEGEECDGGEECTEDCREETLMLLLSRNPGLLAGVFAVLAGSGVGMFFAVRTLRRSKNAGTAGEEAASVDDIPLSQFELPWHKWGKQS